MCSRSQAATVGFLVSSYLKGAHKQIDSTVLRSAAKCTCMISASLRNPPRTGKQIRFLLVGGAVLNPFRGAGDQAAHSGKGQQGKDIFKCSLVSAQLF